MGLAPGALLCLCSRACSTTTRRTGREALPGSRSLTAPLLACLPPHRPTTPSRHVPPVTCPQHLGFLPCRRSHSSVHPHLLPRSAIPQVLLLWEIPSFYDHHGVLSVTTWLFAQFGAGERPEARAQLVLARAISERPGRWKSPVLPPLTCLKTPHSITREPHLPLKKRGGQSPTPGAPGPTPLLGQ